jgi:hypothetical protein
MWQLWQGLPSLNSYVDVRILQLCLLQEEYIGLLQLEQIGPAQANEVTEGREARKPGAPSV